MLCWWVLAGIHSHHLTFLQKAFSNFRKSFFPREVQFVHGDFKRWIKFYLFLPLSLTENPWLATWREWVQPSSKAQKQSSLDKTFNVCLIFWCNVECFKVTCSRIALDLPPFIRTVSLISWARELILSVFDSLQIYTPGHYQWLHTVNIVVRSHYFQLLTERLIDWLMVFYAQAAIFQLILKRKDCCVVL